MVKINKINFISIGNELHKPVKIDDCFCTKAPFARVKAEKQLNCGGKKQKLLMRLVRHKHTGSPEAGSFTQNLKQKSLHAFHHRQCFWILEEADSACLLLLNLEFSAS